MSESASSSIQKIKKRAIGLNEILSSDAKIAYDNWMTRGSKKTT
jgi:hypothetical protein